jgi:hypothetical protein
VNVTFKSEQYGDRVWHVQPEKMPTTEAELIEGVTNKTFVEWGQALLNGSTICGRALVWVLLKRENRGLRFREVVYPVGTLKIELDHEEKQKLREELKRNEDLSDDDKRQILLSLGEDDLDSLDFEPSGEPDDEDPDDENLEANSGNGAVTDSGAERG